MSGAATKDENLLSILSLLAAILLLRGLALVVLWGWFVVPLGPPAIPLPQAIGLGLVASLLCPGGTPPADEPITSRRLSLAFGLPLLTLAIGWIASLFL